MKKFESALAIFYVIEQIFVVVNGQILKKIMDTSGHTAAGPSFLKKFVLNTFSCRKARELC